MTIKIANYKNGRGPRYKLVLVATGDELAKVEEVFGDTRIRCSFDGEKVHIVADKSSAYRWGKYEEKAKRRLLGILHDLNWLRREFAMTEAVTVEWAENELLLKLPLNLSEPIKKTKPRKKRVEQKTDLTLRQAVEAVNAHKARLGNDLCLSIDSKGELRALIEY